MFIEYFQHNLIGTNLCVFTHKAVVCNQSYKLVAKFKIKIEEKVYLKTRYNLTDISWKGNQIIEY